ncbi:Uncharacterized protein TCM_039951 [Theobroma cacao]|uniref:Uncharacterized protein n=1 Tax=Theobroma cacao TaxID=3641 RepID=A0A061GYN6_THECC|nr:Uncharacterized protein TCM_039951 [Theobroma cacao]
MPVNTLELITYLQKENKRGESHRLSDHRLSEQGVDGKQAKDRRFEHQKYKNTCKQFSSKGRFVPYM